MLITDHQLLVKIFGPKTGVPPLSAARMQRWSLILAAYQYDIEYRKSAEHAKADALSRLVSTSADDRLDGDEYLVSHIYEFRVTARASATRKDPVLARVYDFTLHGWPSVVVDPVFQSYSPRKHELSVDQGCVLWGLRVVIPELYRVRLLDDLHQEHRGICRMMSLAKGDIWWRLDRFLPSESVSVVLVSLLLEHPYTRGSVLVNRGNAYTWISLRRTR